MRRMLLAALVASLLPVASSAQSSSLFSGSGRGGQNTGSGGQTGGSGGNSSGGLFNTGSQSTTSGGSGGAAVDSAATGSSSNSNSSGNTVGQGTTDAVGTASGQQVMGADSIGNSAFTGRSENSRFIGVRTTTTNQQSGLNAFNQIFQGLQRGQSGNRNGGQSQPDRLPLRPTLRVGFDFNPTTAAATVSSPRFASRFSGIAERRPQLANVNVMTDDGGRVVLRGTVATEDSKNLAAALLRLEPGVREVVNELNVERPAAD